MIKVLQFTCLKMHFERTAIFAPVLVADSYQLQSGEYVLCGMRGNEFNFTSLITAKSWISDNLAKLAKSGPTKEDYILQLIIENQARPQAYLTQEIATIEARNAGDWSVYFADELTENFELGFYVLDDSALQSVVNASLANLPPPMTAAAVDGQINAALTTHNDESSFEVKKHWLLADINNIASGQVNNHLAAATHLSIEQVRDIVEQSITDVYSVNPMIRKASLVTPVAIGSVEKAHGFDRMPDLIQASLICTFADKGYSAGDELQFGQYAPMGWASSTKIGCVVNSTSFRLFDKVSKAMTLINPNYWVIVIKAFKFN